jgi:DNA polymerase/3'-5' exonuclease PolX
MSAAKAMLLPPSVAGSGHVSAAGGAGASAADASTDRKAAILEALETLRKKELANKESFKAAAYAKVIKQLQPIATIRSYDDVKDIAGIGPKIKAKLEELLATGSLAAAERAKTTHAIGAYDAFLNIYGVGPAKARSLVDAGYTTIADLRTAASADPKLLNKNQHIGLHYYEALLERIPRAEMDRHLDILQLAADDEDYTPTIVGSYRRQAPTSGDIDVLLYSDDPDDLANFVEILTMSKYIIETLAEGKKKFMGICRLSPEDTPRRLDILLTPPAEFAFALLYFTGSDDFNVAMRRHALTLGYSLNEHGLTGIDGKENPTKPFPTEKSIFEFLGLQYVEPPARAAGAAAVKPL